MQLTRRERKGLWLVTTLLAGWLVYASWVGPMSDRIKTLQRIIPDKQSELQQMKQMSNAYVRLCSRLDAVHSSSSDDSHIELLPVVESLLRRYGLLEHVASVKQDRQMIDDRVWESSVTIDWDQIQQSPLIEFLAAVQQSKEPLRISGLTIKKTPESDGRLKVTVRICCLDIQS